MNDQRKAISKNSKTSKLKNLSNFQSIGSIGAILSCLMFAGVGYYVFGTSSAQGGEVASRYSRWQDKRERSHNARKRHYVRKTEAAKVAKPAVAAAPITPTSTATGPAPVPASTPIPSTPTGNGQSSLLGSIMNNVYTTAYTYFDNTPAGSADIAFPKSDNFPTVHNKAGGTGTYNDPLTLAVGHVKTGTKSTPDYAPGTRFYFPDVRKYAIVEDLCGDGGAPQNIPCHNVSTAPKGTSVWLDLWIGGSAGDPEDAVQQCANTVTDSTGALHNVVKDPSPNYAVFAGPVYQNGYCIQPSNKGFGNTLVAL